MLHITSLLRPKFSSLFLSFAIIVCFAAAAHAQSALDGFDPNANDTVLVVVVQPDGKILIGGDFTTLAPNGGASVTRNRIARLNHDGTLDTTFNPNANNVVRSIAMQPDGKILAGGDFTIIGGQTRNYIARLDATTGLADSFDPNASGPFTPQINALAIQGDGKIIASGLFANIGGQTRNNIARLDAVTGLADSFDPNPSGPFIPQIIALAIQADGKILVGGFFETIGGQPRSYVARLDPVTGLADSFNPNANFEVRVIAVQADGNILVGGFFTSIGGQTRNRIARLDAATGAADSWNPNANSTVNTIAVQADGKVLAGGVFTSIGGQTRNNIARLDPVTGAADSFNPNANGTVYSITAQQDGKIVVGGDFTTLSPNGGAAVTRNYIARLETDGRLDRTFDLSMVGSLVLATAVQPDGKILIGGDFGSVLGMTRVRIARLNTDGTLDTAFNPNASGGQVYSIAVQADGKILVGGGFTTIGGQTRNRIARLDAVTGAADSFNPNANSDVFSIAVQADGKILVGGAFTTIGGQPRNRIARIDAVTGLADSFNPNANDHVYSIAVQPDGKILAGGNFTPIGGQTRTRSARLDAATGLADSFDPNASGFVYAIAVQSDGKVLAGGGFTSIGGQTRNHIARLDAATGLADSFDPNANATVNSIAVQADGKVLAGGNFSGPNSIGGQLRNRIARLDAITGQADSFDPNANSVVYSIAVQVDGKILAGGVFTIIGGQTRSLFARLKNDTIATQDLAVTQTTVTWTRGGSSPQFTRVTFEDSTDGINYNFLGNGTATGSNWTLTGLNLSIQQNLYIRARGHYRSGFQNGSESIQESVRNAFLAGTTPSPTNTPTATSTNTQTATPTNTPTPAPTCVSNMISWWPGQGNALDIVSNNDGTLQNGVGFAAGEVGQAFSFDGADDAIFIGNPASLNVTSITIEAWIKTNNFPDGTIENVVAKWGFDASVDSYLLGLLNSGGVISVIGGIGDGASGDPGITGGTVSTNTWTHIAMTYDAANGSNRLYLNGSEVAARVREGGIYSTVTNVYIGREDSPIGRFFNGLIDEPTIFNRALTATEIQAIYNTGSSGKCTGGSPSISGTVTYGNAAAPPKYISNATVTGTGSPNVFTTTAAPGGTAGQYTLTGFGAGSYTVSLSKTTGQNSITSFDAARIAQHVAGIELLTTNNQKVSADVSNNGAVSSFDAGQIATFVATGSSPGIAGQWRFFLPPGPTFPVGASPTSRTYSSVTSSIAGEDYIGLLIGEVSGNWAPGPLRPTGGGSRSVSSPHVSKGSSAPSGALTYVRATDTLRDSQGPERSITITLPNIEVTDKDIIVPVNVQGVADKGIISYEFDLRYDPAVIQPMADAVDVKGTVSRGLSVVANPYEPGLLRVVVYGAMPIDENGGFLNFRFVAVGTPGSVSPLTFERIMFNEGEPRVSTTDGQIELF